tara:strand:+ start:219 stop:932 length:714 start_codon:yes stop_codon:yes gene_type:complete
MARADLPQNLIEALQEVNMSPVMDQGAVWNCRGTPVVYHKALERIAHKKNMRFDPPMIIETDAEKNIAVVCVTGYLGDFSEWSIGESTPRNTTNNYPFAMAEKRAKDRVILKLLGVSGFVYSEAEADNFEKSNPDLAPTEEEKAANALLVHLAKEAESKSDTNGFDPEAQKARNFLREVHMKCSPANMKTSNDFERFVSPDYFAGCMRHAKEHAPEVFVKIEEELAQAARRLKVEIE